MKSTRAIVLAATVGVLATAGTTIGCATSSATPADGPCDFLSADEAANLLGGPVEIRPSVGAGSVDSCYYARTDVDGTGRGVRSEVLGPGSFPVDAAAQFAQWMAPNATTVDGVGMKAYCDYNPQTTPPSTTIVVLLDGDRLYRAIGGYLFCDTMTQFAKAVIGRIDA